MKIKPKFYLRLINLISFITFNKYVNYCLVFDGWNLPYWDVATSMRSKLEFVEVNI